MQTKRELGLGSAAALVVASTVGTGVFTTSGFLLGDLKSRGYVLLVWALGGVVALLGALSYGALVRRIPESGGEYLFLSRTLHPAAGYVAGWVSLLVGFSAPLAFAAHAFGDYSRPWWPGCPPEISGSVLLVVFSLIHAAHVQRAAWVQNVAVAIKVALIAVFCGLAFTRLELQPETGGGGFSMNTFALSLMWVSFSYSGWNAAIYIAGEVRDPERTLPRALLVGTLLVIGLYLVLNLVFIHAAPMEALAGKPEVGRIAAEALGGKGWANAVTSLVALVLISSVSAQVMAGPRVYARMASDGCLPGFLAASGGPPRAAIVLQLAIALLMLWFSTYEWLFTYIGFTLSISTAATVVGLIKLRLKEGAGFRVPGWPVVPFLFLSAVLLITVLSIMREPKAILTGLLTIAVGVVLWFISARRGEASAQLNSAQPLAVPPEKNESA